jgi:xylulokinase
MFLGIDVGTGGTRAILIDRDGKTVASFASEHAAIHSEHIGWAEQGPEDWWRAAKTAIAGALAASVTGSQIEAVGLSLRYFRNTFAPDLSYDELSALASRAPAGSNGLLWAPYLFGERTPHLDPNARAAFVGTPPRTPAPTSSAPSSKASPSPCATPSPLLGAAGPRQSHPARWRRSRSHFWRQIQADVYGHPVELLEAEEGGAFGAALLAGTGINAWPSVEAACDATISVAQTIPPQDADLMNEAYTRYRRIYPSLKCISSNA